MAAPPFSAEGARAIGFAGLELAPGDWLVIDDAETFFDPWMGRRNPIRVLLQYRRNLGISIALAAKDPLDFPRQVRTNTDLWIVHPGGDPDVLLWLRRASVPVEPLADGCFVVGSPSLGWQTITTERLEKGLDAIRFPS